MEYWNELKYKIRILIFLIQSLHNDIMVEYKVYLKIRTSQLCPRQKLLIFLEHHVDADFKKSKFKVKKQILNLFCTNLLKSPLWILLNTLVK